ncbi:hypothetical protein BD779DRAFT_1604734 [Infundibulicybe gibba]|nr:hypothetical protein BD779DRAFT_1604734 [Infundibulicybe gibba]
MELFPSAHASPDAMGQMQHTSMLELLRALGPGQSGVVGLECDSEDDMRASPRRRTGRPAGDQRRKRNPWPLKPELMQPTRGVRRWPGGTDSSQVSRYDRGCWRGE